MSDWYDKTSSPGSNAFGSSSRIRAEYALIETAMAKLPALTSNGIKLIRVNSGGTALEAVTAYESLILSTEALTQSDSHRTFGLNLAAGITVTLPTTIAAGQGWKARFRVETAPTSGNYVITEDTASNTNVLTGGINELEVDTADDGPYSAAFTQVNFIQNIAVIGDYVDIECNGSRYFISGQTNADGGITLT